MERQTMQVNCYLTLDSRGSVRVTKGRPALGFDEVTIGLSLSLPMMLFRKPTLQAVLTIPPDSAIPAEIPVEVISNVQDAVSAATGLQVRVSMAEAQSGE